MPAPGAAARTKLPRLGMTEKPQADAVPGDSRPFAANALPYCSRAYA